MLGRAKQCCYFLAAPTGTIPKGLIAASSLQDSLDASPMLGADGCFFLRTLQVQNKLAIPTKPLHVSIKCLFPAMPKATIVSMQRSGSWPLVYAL